MPSFCHLKYFPLLMFFNRCFGFFKLEINYDTEICFNLRIRKSYVEEVTYFLNNREQMIPCISDQKINWYESHAREKRLLLDSKLSCSHSA